MENKAVSGNQFKAKKPVSNSQRNIKSTPYSQSSNVQNSSQKMKATVRKKSNFMPTIISSIMALIGFSFVGLILWYFIQPSSFNEFWQKTGLPPLPNNSSSQ